MQFVVLLAPVVLAVVMLPGPCASQTAPVAAPAPVVASPPPLTSVERQAIADAIAAAPSQGLPAIAVGAPAAGGDPDQPLMDAAIAYARAERGLVASPRSIDSNFALKPADNVAAQVEAARSSGAVAAWIGAQARVDPAYLALVRMRDDYEAIVAAGGWPTLPVGAPLKVGASDARVAVLRQRLATEGYGSAPVSPLDPAALTLFDPALAAALASFQEHHGLKADGVLAAGTLAALNVPAAARLAAIEANLERARWLPGRMPPLRIEVDIGGPDATLFDGGAPVLTMRAIVGRPDRRTPTFVSSVTAVKFNPPWIVPAGIAAREIFPKARRSPGYLARNDYYVVNGQVIQRPGPKASLGYVKFEMPDPFGVYLHDTPARTLFARDKRWLSHGCMRLEKPRELATALLAGQGWDRAAVDAAIAAGATRTVALKVQPPVFVVYRTVLADTDGHARFRPDVYGWDAELSAALAAR